MKTFDLAVMLGLLGLGSAAIAGTLSLDRGVISAGGGDVLGTGYGLGGTIGQPVAHSASTSAGTLAGRAGYWAQVMRWVNAVPIAIEDQVERRPGQGASVLAADLLLNDSDGDWDVLRLVAVDPVSAGGGTVSREGPWVVYMPAVGADPGAADSFRYQVSDGLGGVVFGTVQVRVATGAVALEIQLLAGPPEQIEVRFQGIAGRTYQLQTAPTMEGPWATAGSITATGAGAISFLSSTAGELRFFRVQGP
jgi:hypothetical protein